MIILIETSVLVSGSICWEYYEEKIKKVLEHKFFRQCNFLFESCKTKGMQESIIVTKTVENEARNALNTAVSSTLKENYFNTLAKKYNYMVLQHIILNDSLDRLDYYIEECSIRLPINTSERDRIMKEEIEPFMKELVKNTVRYLQPPRIPFKAVRNRTIRDEVRKVMYESLPSKGIIYKGMPGNRDLIIMAEATLIKRTKAQNEPLYVASVDKHFKPNPVQIGSYLSPEVTYTGELDSTVRDQLHKKFGFFGEEPNKILELFK
jgi:hypothetical protein